MAGVEQQPDTDIGTVTAEQLEEELDSRTPDSAQHSVLEWAAVGNTRQCKTDHRGYIQAWERSSLLEVEAVPQTNHCSQGEESAYTAALVGHVPRRCCSRSNMELAADSARSKVLHMAYAGAALPEGYAEGPVACLQNGFLLWRGGH